MIPGTIWGKKNKRLIVIESPRLLIKIFKIFAGDISELVIFSINHLLLANFFEPPCAFLEKIGLYSKRPVFIP